MLHRRNNNSALYHLLSLSLRFTNTYYTVVLIAFPRRCSVRVFRARCCCAFFIFRGCCFCLGLPCGFFHGRCFCPAFSCSFFSRVLHFCLAFSWGFISRVLHLSCFRFSRALLLSCTLFCGNCFFCLALSPLFFKGAAFVLLCLVLLCMGVAACGIFSLLLRYVVVHFSMAWFRTLSWALLRLACVCGCCFVWWLLHQRCCSVLYFLLWSSSISHCFPWTLVCWRTRLLPPLLLRFTLQLFLSIFTMPVVLHRQIPSRIDCCIHVAC